MKAFLIIIAIVIIVALGVYFLRDGSTQTNGEETVFCTLDAMLCPDGTYVGRVPPDCEFAACPTPSTGTTSTSTLDIEASINAS